MHLTAGLYKGYKVEVPSGVKPTLSKVRESVFNVLNSLVEVDCPLFLDMFSGSGLMGMEAVSRGYKVISLEKNPKNFKIIKDNFKKIKGDYEVVLVDCMKYLKKCDEKFDVIYIDPPWTDNDFKYSYEEILKNAFLNLKDNGIIIFEQEKIKKLSHQEIEIFSEKLVREKVYGRCKLCFYKN